MVPRFLVSCGRLFQSVCSLYESNDDAKSALTRSRGTPWCVCDRNALREEKQAVKTTKTSRKRCTTRRNCRLWFRVLFRPGTSKRFRQVDVAVHVFETLWRRLFSVVRTCFSCWQLRRLRHLPTIIWYADISIICMTSIDITCMCQLPRPFVSALFSCDSSAVSVDQ